MSSLFAGANYAKLEGYTIENVRIHTYMNGDSHIHADVRYHGVLVISADMTYIEKQLLRVARGERNDNAALEQSNVG